MNCTFVVDGITDKCELNRGAGGSSREDLVTAHGHGHDLCLEAGGQHADFELRADGLVGLHVEALDTVGAVDLGLELKCSRITVMIENMG